MLLRRTYQICIYSFVSMNGITIKIKCIIQYTIINKIQYIFSQVTFIRDFIKGLFLIHK